MADPIPFQPASAMSTADDPPAASDPGGIRPDDVPAVPTPPPTAPTVVPVAPIRAPRSGELTPGWRVATAIVWIGVTLSLASVWNASEQLGLSTWWLGARGEPQPRWVQLSPFVAPVLVVIGAINRVRWIACLGIAAGTIPIVYGAIDLGRVRPLGVLEILIGLAAIVASAASLAGTYRSDPAAR